MTPAMLAKLFNTTITSTTLVSSLNESEETTAALAVSVAEAELAEVGDKPVSVHEAVDGFIVAGVRHAILMGNDGAMRTLAAKMEDANDTMIGATAGRACSDDTFKEITKGMLPSIEKHGDLNFIGYRDGKGALVAMATNDMTSGKTHYFVPVPKNAKSKKPSMETVMGAVAKLKESLAQVNESEDASDTLRDHLTEAYMAIACEPSQPFDSDAPFSIYGNSINVRADSFLAKSPDYGVANYVLKLAVQEAMEKVGKTLADAIFSALNSSAKVKALEVEVRKQKTNESIQEDDAGSQENPHGPKYDEAALREVIKTAHDRLNPSLSTKLGMDDDATDYLGGSKNSERRAYYDARMALGQKLVRSDDGTPGKWVSDPGHFTGGGTGKGDTNESIDEVSRVGYADPEKAKEIAQAKANHFGVPHHVYKGDKGAHVVTDDPSRCTKDNHVMTCNPKKGKDESLDERVGVESGNKAWGFHGTMANIHKAAGVKDHEGEAAKSYQHAHDHLVKTHKVSSEAAKHFLDSRSGRHLADRTTFHDVKTAADVKKHIGAAVTANKITTKEIADIHKNWVEAVESGADMADDGSEQLFEKGDFVSKGGETHIVQNSTGDQVTTAPVKINKETEKYDILGAAVKSAPRELNLLGKSVKEAVEAVDEAGLHAAFLDHIRWWKGGKLDAAAAWKQVEAAVKDEPTKGSLEKAKADLDKLTGALDLKVQNGKITDSSANYAVGDMLASYLMTGDSSKLGGAKHILKAAGVKWTGESLEEEKKGIAPGEGNGTVSPYAGKDDDGDEDSTGEDPDETVAVIVKGPEGLELRAGYDGEGELIASEKCDPNDDDEAKSAQGRLASKATEQGFVYVPFNMKEAYQHVENVLIPMVLKAQGKDGIDTWTEAVEAAMAKDEPADVLAASLVIAELAETELLSGVVEGLTHRAHKRGRRPGLRTRFKMPNGKRPAGKTGPGHTGTMSHPETGKQGIKIHEGCTGEGCTHASHTAEADAADGQPESKTGVPGSKGTVKTGALKDAGPGTQGTFSTPAKGEKGMKVGVKESSAAAILAAKIAGRKVTEVDTNQQGLPDYNKASIRKPKTPGPQNLIPRSDADAKTEAVAQEGTSKDQMSKQDACPNCENTHDITVGKNSVTCNNCGYKGTPADFQLPSSVGDMAEAWIQDARKMGLDEFVADITARAEKDSDAEFSARVSALREAYRSGPGKKDIARKVTAANPVVKKRIGKGISLEGLDSPAVAYTRICFPRGRVDEFLALALKAGSAGNEEVVIEDATIHIAMPADTAAKVKALFSGPDISYSPLA